MTNILLAYIATKHSMGRMNNDINLRGTFLRANTYLSTRTCRCLKAKFHYTILLANQLASWFASWSARRARYSCRKIALFSDVLSEDVSWHRFSCLDLGSVSTLVRLV